MQTQMNFLDINTDTTRSIPTQESVETSRDSRDILNKHKNRYRYAIYEYIKNNSGATCDEIEVNLKMRHETASGIIRFLTLDRLLRDSQERRRTRTGRKAIVWVVVE